jgi:hypothetical protein
MEHLAVKTVTVFMHTDRFRPVPHKYFGKHTYLNPSTTRTSLAEIYTWVATCLENAFDPASNIARPASYSAISSSPDDILRSTLRTDRFRTSAFVEQDHRRGELQIRSRHGRFAALEARGDWQGKSQHRGNDSYHMVGRDTLGQGKKFSKSMRFLSGFIQWIV